MAEQQVRFPSPRLPVLDYGRIASHPTVVSAFVTSSLTGFFLEYDDAFIQRQLVCVEFRRPVTRGLAAVPVDEIGHAFTGHKLRRSSDFKMQMRFSSISGSADARQRLP